MLDSGQLDAQVFPNITFTSTGCAASGAGVIVSGTMSMHGVGKAVAPLMNITADGTTFTAKGTLTVNTTSFGIDPYSALLGQLKNQDGVRFTIDVKGGR
jgi:polyisoprenoid-binding protein YceI